MFLDDIRKAGEIAGNRCADKAERADPEFRAKAATAILEHLKVVGECSGEELTDIAIAKGAKPHDARAFGPVFAALSREGKIRSAGFCLRKKGHGTAGGRVWALCAA